MDKSKAPKEDNSKGKWQDPSKSKLHVSKDDLHHTLHAHFQAAKGKATENDKLKMDKYTRKHVVSFLQVKKVKKVQTSNKRMFNSFGSTKCRLLCITTHEAIDPDNEAPHTVVQVHHVNFQSNFTIEIRKTWSLESLESVENCLEDVEKYSNGAFRTQFDDKEHEPTQWIVDDDESPTAMMEFVWSILAYSANTLHTLPKITFSLDDLNALAKQMNLAKKFGVEVDLEKFQATPSAPLAPSKIARQRSTSDDPAGALAAAASWKSVEYEDAVSLFATIQWGECTAESVQAQWQQRLKLLEDENIDFLLTLQNKDKATIEVISSAVDVVLQHVNRAEKWTEEAEATLATTAANMSQFETLNNHMEVHYKNSIALQEALGAMIRDIDIDRESMGILLKPISIFPHDSNIPEDDTSSNPSLPKILEAIQRLEGAIKSVDSYPAKEMSAFQGRREELSTLGATFGGKLLASFEAYMQNLAKGADQAGQSRRRSLSGGHEVPTPRKSIFSRDREMSDVNDDRTRRSSSTKLDEADWTFSNERIHSSLMKYQEILQSVASLGSKSAVTLRDIYAKHVVPIYSNHLHALFRTLKDKVPKPKAHGMGGKTSQWNINLSFSHASSESTISISASTLLQQALDHIVPLCIAEQTFVHGMFFSSNKHQKPEPVELTVLMERLFEKLPKRLVEFGDAGVSANVFEAVSMIVTAQQQLKAIDGSSEYIVNTLLNFQLHLKRSLSKYMEEQELWLASTHPDTRLVGVLSPVQKMMNLVTRLCDAATGISTDDPSTPLAAIYERIIVGLFAWLEKAAATKPKYAHLVRLENYHFIHGKLQQLSEHSLPLKQYADDSFVEYSKNLDAYVMWLWECEVGKFTALFNTIETLLETLPLEEVQFHLPKQDIRKAGEFINQNLDKSMRHIGERLKKHLSHSADMATVVVECLRVRTIPFVTRLWMT
ncbi:hypothetical protein, variant 1 [Aphanomyces invadans]|uniref:Exocyst complex component Sec3 PIP2-binding N-terminal domain-containing protein n=1 Tax=Aphanomyces invadans TaxID=157072 RepID=A0A024UQA2_9STRA|nr:hypothetical protein, variant 1 [Aphanomyces invadans]ETW08626.1 hypothetical protein, variant 1 [Aphanomyces invadans]|eukprot:XP_008862432.1 hypothetical protein, variant 1 [Aphanomyces invadans]